MKLVKENIGPGIVVSLVSIPLSTALSMASLCTPMMGLSSAIYGPAIGGILGGSDYNILGPAGALVAVLSSLVNEYGQEIVPWVAIFAGIFSVGVWAANLNAYCTLIPNSVLEGFSMGVGVTIGCGQLNFALGLDNPHPKSLVENLNWTFSNLGEEFELNVFLPFLILFVSLFSLMKFLPGKPWIILIAFIGNMYGIIVNKALSSVDEEGNEVQSSIRPLLL